ncbi:MAG: hypothetical protein M3Y77_18370 [Actinomycetota bacterium]|nr:hypothetical protein [Actinomycetota bacterium]
MNLSAPPRPVPAPVPSLVDAQARKPRSRLTGDARWVWASLALVAVAAIVGPILQHGGSQLFVNAAPLLGDRKPHLGIGSPFAIAFAVAAVALFPRLVRRVRWRPLLLIGWLAAIGWTVSLALIDGWQRGWVDRLTNSNEYLHDLPRIGSISGFLSTFASDIKDFQPGSWTTHVAGHPPAATLVFLLLDRVGLSGGAWAGVVVVGVGTLAAVAVPITLRGLGAPRAARSVLPFTVFFPGAVWVGVSADGLFAGVAATGLAMTLVGVLSRRRFAGSAAVFGGLLLGLTVYLSYGLVLLIVIVAAACLCSAGVLATRGGWLRPWLIGWSLVTVGVLAVIALFSAAGFSWFQGLAELQVRYYQGIASLRPYSYFVWANLAALVLSAGPVAAAGLARAVTVLRHPAGGRLAGSRLRVRQQGSWWADRAEMLVPATIAVAALLAVLIADLSGLSKAETERIWLPFGFFLVCGLALLPRRAGRWAIAVQVGCALVVNHLVLTQW